MIGAGYVGLVSAACFSDFGWNVTCVEKDAHKVEQLNAGETPRGLPTGTRTRFGETLYFEALWEARYRSMQGCDLYVPIMEGWGSNLVVMMPKGLTAIRLAKTTAEREPSANDPTSMLTVAERLVPFCH